MTLAAETSNWKGGGAGAVLTESVTCWMDWRSHGGGVKLSSSDSSIGGPKSDSMLVGNNLPIEAVSK